MEERSPESTGESTARPVMQKERIALWDTLRGVAVLGVLLANMPWMSFSRMMLMDGRSVLGPEPGSLDVAAFWFVRIFADTKFITIFSMLFGAGLGLAAFKAEERGAPFYGPYSRRLALLLVFGFIHGCLIWFGDILGHYAIIGFVAMWFHRFSPRTLALAGGSLLLLGFSVTVLTAAMHIEFFTSPVVIDSESERLASLFSGGDFLAMAEERFGIYAMGLVKVVPFWGMRTLGLFFLGMALVKSGILRHPEDHRVAYSRMLKIGLPVGLVAQGIWCATGVVPQGTSALLIHNTAMYAAALGLSPAYLALVYFWSEGDLLSGLRGRLASVGQMALTNYISHSVITGIIFNYLGYYDEIGRFGGLMLTFAIFAFQLWSSPLWLARFRFGPLEWLWRSATYWKFQPLRRGVGS